MQPNPTHQKLKKNSDPTQPMDGPNPTQPNPTHGWTQPMTNSGQTSLDRQRTSSKT